MFNRMNRKCAMCAGIVLAGGSALCATGTASASLIINADTANSTEGLGNFTGSLDYLYAGGSQGWLTVSLTNTSDPLNGGFITGFAFNIDSVDNAASATLISGSHAFAGIVNANAAPFGTYDAGAALGGSWIGGGSPNAGIAVGDTGVFVFSVLASDAMNLAAASFIAGPGYGFVVRLRGFEDGGSDKVPGTTDTPVPAPGAASLLAIAGLVGIRRRRSA